MNHVYCLLFEGAALNDDIRNFLFSSAQELMNRRDRKMRLRHDGLGIKGFIKTSYKLGMIGNTCGFTFKAEFEWDNGETKTDFIVKPVSQALLDHLGRDAKWVAMNADYVPQREPWRN